MTSGWPTRFTDRRRYVLTNRGSTIANRLFYNTERFMKKYTKVSSMLTAAAVATMLLSEPVLAQSTGSGQATTSSSTRDDDRKDHDYGWLGLLGLAGLFGLRRRGRDDVDVGRRPVTR